MAIAALVLGIVSLVLVAIVPGMGWIGVIIGIVGIILAAIAKKKGIGNPKLATAGLVLSIIAVALCLIFWLACAACVAGVGSLAGL